ncbi:MAG: PSD1 and planctomycete cytochrome C domain-containing protein [Phycisphaeraceae bacterium]
MNRKTRWMIACPLLALASAVLPSCGDGPSTPSRATDAAVQRVAAEPGEPGQRAGADAVSFNRDIRPILSENCFACHGPDPKTREAGLRLDVREAAVAVVDGYRAIAPGDHEASEAWLRMTDDLDPMPPVKSHKKLTPDEIELIARWIDEGAEYETHWAYVPPTRPALPRVKNEAWVANPVDRFVLARLEALGVAPSPRATKRELMRRVSFDLTGLPPTPEQARAFMQDDSPDAYPKYVDQLLADPAFGEHLAVWWLDLVRYGDSKGYHGDQERSPWAYRDWVVNAFNDNMPFDRFSIMQLGGDLMGDDPTREMLVASAYNRLALQTEEGGAQHKEYEAIYNADRVGNFGDVWLGSSVACAQCHDHKFDPITAEDYYTLAAFFADINQQIIGHRSGYALHSPPYVFVPQNDEQAALIAEHEAKYNAFIDEHPGAMVVEERLTSRDYIPPSPDAAADAAAYEAELKALLKERADLANKVPVVITTRALETPRTVRVLNRGNWQDESGKVVLPATPAFLPGIASTDTERKTRLDLAQWLFEPDHPLTARVVVNRLWGKYLGSPLSVNTIDLGSQGKTPTHPELLDYLAVEFRDSGWDLKQAIRLIVTSETYKQSANFRADLAETDPGNTRLFARQSAMRLPAESIRDVALHVSGLLNDEVGGPAVFPYQPDGHWDALNFPRRPYPTSKGDDLYRRSLYSWVQRTFPHPLMVSFDAPSRETCVGQRTKSSTPLQSLALLNGPIFVESARVLAERLIRAHDTDDQRLDALYERALARSPRDSERQALSALLASQREQFKNAPEDAQKLASAGQHPAVEGLDPSEVAAWTSVCRVVLNLHETITRN